MKKYDFIGQGGIPCIFFDYFLVTLRGIFDPMKEEEASASPTRQWCKRQRCKIVWRKRQQERQTNNNQL